MSHDFKVGDRVRHISYGKRAYIGEGVIERLNVSLGKMKRLIDVRWDAGGTTLQGCKTLALIERAKPVQPDSTSETFRGNTAMRKWETSYTLRVSEALLRARRFILLFHGNDSALIDANNLLKGYWKDLHVPYAQRDEAIAARDAAIAESKRIGEVCDRFRKELSHQDEVIEKLREALAEAKKPKTNNALLTKAASPFVAPRRDGNSIAATIDEAVARKFGLRPSQPAAPSFRCIHWPLATSNILDGRTTCEHGCHTVPLEFWHNGTHRAPLNRNWQSQTAGAALDQQNGANRA